MKIEDIRDHYRVAPGYWFAPKLFGYGATPVTWQGWLATLGYAGLLAAAVGLPEQLPIKLALAIPLTLGFLWVVVTKTEGGLHWQWGPRNDR